MRPLKPLALLAVPAAALALSACGGDGVDVSVGGDDVASASITADGRTYQVTDLHMSGSSATAKTKSGQTLKFHKVGDRWTVVR